MTLGIVDIEEARKNVALLEEAAKKYGKVWARHHTEEELKEALERLDLTRYWLLNALTGTVSVETAADRAYEEDED